MFDGAQYFDYPKPVDLLKKSIHVATNKDSIILDFFAGSGTTAQAVMELNQADGGHRKYILVQLPEPTEHTEFPTIADITRERVRRVITQLQPNSEKPLGFKAYRVDDSNFKRWDAHAENVQTTLPLMVNNLVEGCSDEAILTEILLSVGWPLDVSITLLNVADHTVYAVDNGRMLICLSRELNLNLIEAMLARKPIEIICLEQGFAHNDQLKVNVLQTLKTYHQQHPAISVKVV